MMENSRKKFKDVIRMLESSGGKNTKHKTIQSGLHEGDTAGGDYGIMPNTMDEMLTRNPIPYSPKYIKKLKVLEPDQKKQLIEENPQFQELMADRVYDKIKDTVGEDELKQAAAWTYGHNRPAKDPFYTSGKYLDTDYVKKYKKLAPQFEEPNRDVADMNIEQDPKIDKNNSLSDLFNQLMRLKGEDNE